jgi:hypothetical protein
MTSVPLQNMLVFRVSDVRLLLPSKHEGTLPVQNMKEHFLFSVCDRLIKIFTPALHIWKMSLQFTT